MRSCRLLISIIGILVVFAPVTAAAEIRVETAYGIPYDITELPANFNLSPLVVAVANLNEFLADGHIVISGVRVTSLGVLEAKISKTTMKFLSGGRQEPEKYILEISHDLAYQPEKIQFALEGTVVKSEGQKNRQKVEKARRETLTNMFEDVQIPGQAKSEPGKMDRLGKAGVGLVKKVGGVVVGEEKIKDIHAGIQQYEYSFEEIFSAERPGAVLTQNYDFSVSGLDINEDGIRDDVYYYIRSEYRRDIPAQEALKQVARVFQQILSSADDKNKSIELARQLGYAMECLASVRPNDSQIIGEALIDVILDTEVRGEAYLKHHEVINGMEFPASPQKEWSSRCEYHSGMASAAR